MSPSTGSKSTGQEAHSSGALFSTAAENLSNICDLTRICLTSLALVGFSGCAPSNSEVIESRPAATPNGVIDDQRYWIGKQVTIHGELEVVRDNSQLRITQGDWGHPYIDLDVHYRFKSDGTGLAEQTLPVVQRETIDMTDVGIPFNDPTKNLRLSPDTVVVSGTIEKFTDDSGIYLRVDKSLQRSEVK